MRFSVRGLGRRLGVLFYNPFPGTNVVYAQVMDTGAGYPYVVVRSARRTRAGSAAAQIPGSMCDANQGIYRFDFGTGKARRARR